jgi:hypothetical protein
MSHDFALITVSDRCSIEKQQTRSASAPNAFVNIEMNFAVVPHLQQHRLAIVLVLDIDPLHHIEDLQRFFPKSFDYFLSISLHMNLSLLANTSTTNAVPCVRNLIVAAYEINSGAGRSGYRL